MRRVGLAVDGGVDMVQLREKDLSADQLAQLAAELLNAIGGRASLIINDRAEVATQVGAQGVQLGEDAIPVGHARKLLRPGTLIGRSVHSVEAARAASSDGADFLVVGTVYATGTHPEVTPAGPALVSAVARDCGLPLIGIGGITSDNAGEVVGAGATGVAVIRSILAHPDPAAAAWSLKQSLVCAWKGGPSAGNAVKNSSSAA